MFCLNWCHFLLLRINLRQQTIIGFRINDHTSALTLVFVLSFRYWRYNEDMRTMDPGYPKPITVWKGIPDSPQGAFVDKANG